MRMALAALRTAIWAPIFLAGTVTLVLAAMVAQPWSPRGFHRSISAWGAWNRGCARWLLGQRLVIEGTIPDGPVFFVWKHEGMFETIDMPHLLRRPVVFAKQELFRVPIWGRLAKIYGLIPIERSAGASALRTMRRAALAAIADGRPLVLFPEGTRVNHGVAPPLGSGFAGVYKLLGLPVVPVALDSGALIRHGWIRLPGIIRYRVGETIPPGLPRDQAEARAHVAINALNSVSG
jgi:1-acyl-sn-glycerol-3-phosphate acyltransferase